MDRAQAIELIDRQIADANDGRPADFDEWKTKTDIVLRNILGEDSNTLKTFRAVRYSPSMYTVGTDFRPYRESGVRKAASILQAAKFEVELQDDDTPIEAVDAEQVKTRVFVVHGHDDGRKHELARVLRGLTGDDPVILHEQPNQGRVLVEKFEHNAAASGFAVVLMTADDVGRANGATDDHARARQNVVFEAGFFCGALGRANVVLLHDENVEIPSDLQGIVYVPLDKAGAWKSDLARELEAAGWSVKWSALGGS